MTINNLNLMNETKSLFENAIALLEYNHRVEMMSDEVLGVSNIQAQEYRSGLTFIKSAIIDDEFVSRAAQDVVRDAIVAYRDILPNDHKMTAGRIDRYLTFVDSKNSCELANALFR